MFERKPTEVWNCRKNKSGKKKHAFSDCIEGAKACKDTGVILTEAGDVQISFLCSFHSQTDVSMFVKKHKILPMHSGVHN